MNGQPALGRARSTTVTIYTDGTVVYNGERFVDVEGEQTATIDPETVQQLVAGFEAAGYFGWDDEYTDMHITDLPTIITSVARDGETKQITRYAGDDSAPAACHISKRGSTSPSEPASGRARTCRRPA
ncbi:MAG: DUF6438 domain-containing protein [Anaerolineae bacterium]